MPHSQRLLHKDWTIWVHVARNTMRGVLDLPNGIKEKRKRARKKKGRKKNEKEKKRGEKKREEKKRNITYIKEKEPKKEREEKKKLRQNGENNKVIDKRKNERGTHKNGNL